MLHNGSIFRTTRGLRQSAARKVSLKTIGIKKSAGALVAFVSCLIIVAAILPQRQSLAQQTSPTSTATWTPYVIYVTATPTAQASSTVLSQQTTVLLPPAVTQTPGMGRTITPERNAARPVASSWPMPDATPTPSDTVRITLTDLGYESAATASGVRAVSSITFPLPAGGISGGVLTLYLSVSPLLNPLSSIRIDVDNKPAATFFTEAIGTETTVTLPVGPTQKGSLKVTMTGQLFVSNDLCFDQDSASLWFALREDSGLVYTPIKTELATIHEFLTQELGTIQMRGLWDTPAHQASSIALFSALKYIYRDTHSLVSLATETAPADTPLNEHNLPASQVWLVDDTDAPPISLQGNTLYVQDDRKALRELISQAGQALQLGKEVTTLKTVPAVAVFPRDAQGLSDYRLYLNDMGIGNQERQGFSGEFSVHLYFTPANFGGWPADLQFFLDSVFDPVPTDTLERSYLRLRLNGRLLQSVDIRGETALRTQVSLPSEALEAKNDLKVSFAYAPEAGFCYGAPWAFTGQVLDSSYFTWSRYATSPNVFPMLLGQMSGEGQIFLIDSNASTAQAVAQLIGDLSLYTAQPLLPNLKDLDDLKKTGHSSSYRIVVGGAGELLRDLGLPLALDGEVEIVDPTTDTIILKGSSNRPLVAMQYLAEPGPLLAFQADPTDSPQALLDAVSRMTDPKRFLSLEGNVVVGTARETIAFDPSNSALQVRSLTPIETEPTWLDTQQDRLERNRLPLALLLIAFVLALSLLIARRMGRRLPPPAPPKD